jgi:hypothetical protein
MLRELYGTGPLPVNQKMKLSRQNTEEIDGQENSQGGNRCA